MTLRNDDAMPLSDVQTLWQQVQDGLRAFLAQRVAIEADIDDFLQEVFMRLHSQLHTLREAQRLVSWVFQITRHVLMDYYRSPARRREMPAGLAADFGSAVTAPPEVTTDLSQLRAELATCLQPLIAQLPPSYRDAITMVELEGVTQRAAAERLHLSVSGMKSRVQRGRQQLQQLLQACCRIQFDRRGSAMDYTPSPQCQCNAASTLPQHDVPA